MDPNNVAKLAGELSNQLHETDPYQEAGDASKEPNGSETASEAPEKPPEEVTPQDSPSESSQDQRKRPKGRKPKDPSKQALNLQRQVDYLREKEKTRIENTPRVAFAKDNLCLEYQGKVAGKVATRSEPIIRSEHVQMLAPVLRPIVEVMNAALRGKKLEAAIMRDDDGKALKYGDNTVYKAGAVLKAEYAYGALLDNPDFRQALDKLNEVIERVYTQEGAHPSDLKSVIKTKDPEPRIKLIEKLVRSGPDQTQSSGSDQDEDDRSLE